MSMRPTAGITIVKRMLSTLSAGQSPACMWCVHEPPTKYYQMKIKVDITGPSYLSYGPFDELMREAEANSAAVPKARFGLSEARTRISKAD